MEELGTYGWLLVGVEGCFSKEVPQGCPTNSLCPACDRGWRLWSFSSAVPLVSQDESPLFQCSFLCCGVALRKVSRSGLKPCRERDPFLSSLLPRGMSQGPSKHPSGGILQVPRMLGKKQKSLNRSSCTSPIAEQHLSFAEVLVP